MRNFTIVEHQGRLLTAAAVLLCLAVNPASRAACPEGAAPGLLAYGRSVGDHALGIDIEGNHAFVGDWHQGSVNRYAGVLQTFDISDPCHPVRLDGSIETTEPGRHEIGDLAAYGNRVFVANDANGFAVYDVSDANSPVLLDRRSDATFAHSVFYEGGRYAYVGYGWSPDRELVIYDVANLPLDEPTVYPLGTDGLSDIQVYDDWAYALSPQAFHVLDVSDPTGPTEVSRLPLPGERYGVDGELRLMGHFAILARAQVGDRPGALGGLRVVDISDVYNPVVVASEDIPGGAGNVYAKGIGLAVAGDRAYIAARGGLWVYDLSDPLEPELVQQFPLPAEFVNSMGAHVEVRDQLAYLTAYGLTLDDSVGGLAIYNLAHRVRMEIKPDYAYKCINLNGTGVIPVAILGSDTLDVATIDSRTLSLNGLAVQVRGDRAPLCLETDVNQDEYPDRTCYFEDDPDQWIPGDATAVLTGERFNGTPIQGEEPFCIAP